MTKTQAKKQTFKLKEGVAPHYEVNPDFDAEQPEDQDNQRSFECLPGKTVQSTRNLDQIFVNKFEVVKGGEDRRDAQSAGGDVPSPDHPGSQRAVTSVEDAQFSRPNRHLTDDELEGKPELQKLAKGRKVASDEEVQAKHGDDVTDDFEGASDADLKVFQKGSVYHVADADNPLTALTPKKGLKKSEVGKFVKKYAAGDDSEDSDKEE